MKGFIIMAIVLFSCCDSQKDNPKQNNGFDFEEFKLRRATWEELKIDHYRFTIQTWDTDPTIHVDPLYTITVFPDREPVIEIHGEAWDFRPLSPFTIDQYFEKVYRLSGNLPAGNFIAVWYNEEYHFPEIVRNGSGLGYNGGGYWEDRIIQFEDLRD